MKIELCQIPALENSQLLSLSPFCLKVHAALRIAGLNYEVRDASNPAAFKKYNPLGQVPVLLVSDASGTKAIADSTDILRFIAEQSGQLIPDDAKQAAQAWHWEAYADSVLNGYLVSARWLDDENWAQVCETYFADMPGFIRAIVPGRLRKGVLASLKARGFGHRGSSSLWQEYETELDRLESLCPHEGFWVSESFSVADASIYGPLQGLRSRLTVKQANSLARRPKLSAYLDRAHEAVMSANANS